MGKSSTTWTPRYLISAWASLALCSTIMIFHLKGRLSNHLRDTPIFGATILWIPLATPLWKCGFISGISIAWSGRLLVVTSSWSGFVFVFWFFNWSRFVRLPRYSSVNIVCIRSGLLNFYMNNPLELKQGVLINIAVTFMFFMASVVFSWPYT